MNSWVSSAGVLAPRRARARPSATNSQRGRRGQADHRQRDAAARPGRTCPRRCPPPPARSPPGPAPPRPPARPRRRRAEPAAGPGLWACHCRAPPRPRYPEPVRALLIVNPRATSTTALRRDVIARALASAVDLDGHGNTVPGPRHPFRRGGRCRTATAWCSRSAGTAPPTRRSTACPRPSAGPWPGGPARRSPRCRAAARTSSPGRWDCLRPVDATGQLLAALAGGGRRTSGSAWPRTGTSPSTPGWAWTPRWSGRSRGCARMGRRQARGFTCGPRCAISTASPTGGSPQSPWTSTASPPPSACSSRSSPTPHRGPTWAAGRSTPVRRPASTPASTCSRAHAAHAGHDPHAPPHAVPGRPGSAEPAILSLHDESELAFPPIRPIAFQVDGEYVGEHEHVTLRPVPDALRVIS